MEALWIDRFAGSANCLVVMGALLGAVLGVSLALIVGNAETSRAVGAPGRERAAVLAAGPPSSRPPASRAASSQDFDG